MLRQVVARSRRPWSRRHVAAVTTTVGATTATCCYYYYKNSNNRSDSTLGLRRQGEFWLRVAPIVFDYYWNFASSSPLVRYQAYIETSTFNNNTKAQGAQEEAEEEESAGSLLRNNPKKKMRSSTSDRDRAALQQELHERHAPTVLQIFLDLKGLYVKLGQVLSVTALPIPETYREHFRTLQSDVPGYEEFERTVKPTLERELGTSDLSSIFSYIDPIPCGAASIGQAHRATLLRDGSEVVVKIQYPEAAWQVPADIECVGHLRRKTVI
jgi:ABC1 atypical kinase-like domain